RRASRPAGSHAQPWTSVVSAEDGERVDVDPRVTARGEVDDSDGVCPRGRPGVVEDDVAGDGRAAVEVDLRHQLSVELYVGGATLRTLGGNPRDLGTRELPACFGAL